MEHVEREIFWEVGKTYFIRTVTMYHIGELVDISKTELRLKCASWVADTGRFNNALKTGELSEVEPFVNDVCVSRLAIVDATLWDHKLPTEVIG